MDMNSELPPLTSSEKRPLQPHKPGNFLTRMPRPLRIALATTVGLFGAKVGVDHAAQIGNAIQNTLHQPASPQTEMAKEDPNKPHLIASAEAAGTFRTVLPLVQKNDIDPNAANAEIEKFLATTITTDQINASGEAPAIPLSTKYPFTVRFARTANAPYQINYKPELITNLETLISQQSNLSEHHDINEIDVVVAKNIKELPMGTKVGETAILLDAQGRTYKFADFGTAKSGRKAIMYYLYVPGFEKEHPELLSAIQKGTFEDVIRIVDKGDGTFSDRTLNPDEGSMRQKQPFIILSI